MQCGAKIDLSMIVTADQATGARGEVVVKGGGAAGSLGIGRLIQRAVSLAILAAFAVCGLLMWQDGTPARDMRTDTVHAVAAKAKLDTLSQALQDSKTVTTSISESEINSYLGDARSPHPAQVASAGGFPPKLVKYQVELNDGRFSAVGVARMQIGGFSKEFIVRADGAFADNGDARQVKWVRAFIGRLPLHGLPGCGWLAGIFAGSYFKIPDYETEWGVLKGARTLTLTSGKAVISVGPAAH
jgi:hypothetical protein